MDFTILGKELIKVEAIDKVTGRLKFSGDMFFPNMLHMKILRSPHAHARVIEIDTSKVKRLKGVKSIITFRDVPKFRPMHQFLHMPWVMYYDSFLLEETVRHVGDRIAAVAAITPDIAEEAIELIRVEYEGLEAVFDPLRSIEPGAPVIHDFVRRGEKRIEVKNNIVSTREIEIGDVKKGFSEADLVLENVFKTSRPNNAPLERSVVVCIPETGGKLQVYSTTQGIHPLRMNLASSLGLPLHKVNVHRSYLGGSFGAHIHMGFIEPLAGFLALRTGQPIRAEKSREEMFLSCGRHPMIVRLKTGIKRDGRLVAQLIDLIDDTGAYAFSGESKMVLAAGFSMSMYRCPHQKFMGKTVYTNTPPLTAMRGAGNPQVHFAVESQMDIIAKELNIDPIALRLKNHIREGDTFFGQGHDVVCQVQSCGTEQLFKEGSERIGWKNKKEAPHRPWMRRGIGLAKGFHTSGCGSPEPSKFIMDYSGAILKMNEDGSISLISACADAGGGTLTGHAAIVAEQLGIGLESVSIYNGDTETTLFDVPTHASRGTYGSGLAVEAAVQKVKETLFEWGSRIFETPVERLQVGHGKVWVADDPERCLSFEEVSRTGQYKGWGTIMAEASIRPTACPPHFTVFFVEVEVDTQTGEVRVLRAVGGADVGTVINRPAVEGQIAGGLHMGLGFGLLEDTVIDRETGKVTNPNFSDYKIFTALDMPTFEAILANTFEPTGPSGAKGIGEGVTNPVAPAVCNAIYDAVGVRIKELPVTPEKILKALKQKV
ncbi:MAG TPA: molybdopterin cofactor-binding domain-containing protein [Thermodesulfobacteriota bacterium]|nr:molybdopterin cofactor-binding domain-containing protein [Thermodesulfobacteriota bacterium]